MKGRDTDAKIRHELPWWDMKATAGVGAGAGSEPRAGAVTLQTSYLLAAGVSQWRQALCTHEEMPETSTKTF